MTEVRWLSDSGDSKLSVKFKEDQIMQIKETQRHIEAFEYLIALGGTLTMPVLQKLTSKFQISIKTVYNWYHKLGWADRIYARNEKIRQEAEKKTNTQIVNQITKHRKDIAGTLTIINSAIKTSLMQQPDGKVGLSFKVDNPRSLAELARSQKDLVALDIQLIGKDETNIDEPIEREWSEEEIKKAGSLIDQLNKLRKGDI